MALPIFDFDVYVNKRWNLTVNPDEYTLVNAPDTLTAVFNLVVMPSFENNSLIQYVIVGDFNIIYTRERIADSFSPWRNLSNGGRNYKGTYNATTNSPTLTNGIGTAGDYYLVTVAGTNNPTGSNLPVGYVIIYNGTIWQAFPSPQNTDSILIADDYVVEEGDIDPGITNLTQALGYLQYDLENLAIANVLTTLGDMIYGEVDGVPTRLAGNASNTTMVLKSTGASGVATAPEWGTLASTNLSDFSIAGLVSAQLLIYSTTNSKWNNRNITGDVLLSEAGATTIDVNKVTNTKLAKMGAYTIKGNNTGSLADPTDLSISQFQNLFQLISPLPKGVNYLVLLGDYIYRIMLTADNLSMTMPVNPTANATYYFKNAGNFLSNIISGNGRNIDGNANLALAAYESVGLYFDGTQFWTVG